MTAKKQNDQKKGVNIQSGASTTVHGDVVGGNQNKHDSTTTITGSTGVVVSEQGDVSLTVETPPQVSADSFAQWQAQIEAQIEASGQLSAIDKKDLIELTEKIRVEGEKQDEADPSRFEKLINMIGVMSPDIFEVAITTLANPLAGIGLVCKKIGDKATKIESQTKSN